MEKDIDSIKEISSNEEETLKKTSFTKNNNEKDQSELNIVNSIENNLEGNKPNENNELSNKKINENVVVPVQKDFNKNNIGEESSNNVLKDIKDVKIGDQSKSSNVVETKPKKEIPIEKKPFNEFINDYLLPSLVKEFKERGFEVEDIYLKNTSRPIAGDKCWVVYCEIKDICNFWLSFEKDDISSLKSISLCKSNQRPSVIESFLIDEKRITLKLIISRILQRLNGQKLIGIN